MREFEYTPMLATFEERIPHGEDWEFEVKFDGYRALAYLRSGECRLVSRNGHDLTVRFAAVAQAIPGAVRAGEAVLDGEVCRLGDEGGASFSGLQRGTGPLVYYAFDLLEVDGEPLLAQPLSERRRRLRELLDGSSPTVRFSEAFDDGEALFAAARERGLEGIVAKRRSSPYRQGRRTREWLKIKAEHSDEFVIAGYTRGSGRRAGTFGALVLGIVEGGALRYVGNVGTGFGDDEIRRLLGLLRPLHRDAPPFPAEPRMPRVRRGDVQWVEPLLVAQVRYAEWTHDGRLRHAAYLGLRDDKAASEVTRPSLRADGGRVRKQA